MPIIAKQETTNFEPIPTGTIQAVCCFVNDIGLQPGEFNGEKNLLHKVIISWELAEKKTDGKPFIMSKFYTLSLGDKSNLKRDLESWRGKAFTDDERQGFDIETLVGANCLLTIVAHKNDKDKRVIAGIAALPKSMSKILITQTAPGEKFQAWIDKERAKAVNPHATEEEHELEENEPTTPF